MYPKIQKDIENLKSSAKKYLADKETLELINKFINNYGHIDNINSIDVQDDYDSDYYEILNILHDYELIHSFDQVNILYTKAKKQFTEISNKQAGFDPDFANLQASFHQFEKFVTTNTKVLVDEYHTLHNIKQKFKELHNKFNIDLKQINLKSISNDDNDVEKIIQGDDKVIITKYNQVKSLLNQSKIKIPLSIAGVVGGYLLACKIAKQVPGLNITNNPLNNFKQFLKLRPLNSKREALALAVLIGAAYSAYKLGSTLTTIIKNKAKSKREFADSLSTKENRYKSDKKIIEEAILEKDWEVLKSMRNDRRLKEFPDLVKMVEEALKSKPLTEAEEMQSDYGARFKKRQEIKRKSANGEYDDLKADKKLVNEHLNSPVDKNKVSSAYDDIHKHYNVEPSKEQIAKAIKDMHAKNASSDSLNVSKKLLSELQKQGINKNALAGAGGYIIAYAVCKSKGLPVSKINIFKNFKIFLTINPFKGFSNFVVFASAFICLYNVVKSGKKILDVIKETPPGTISLAKLVTRKVSTGKGTQELMDKTDKAYEDAKQIMDSHQNKMNAIEVNYDVSKKYLKELEDAYNSKDEKKIQQIAKVANDDKRLDDNTRPNINTHVKLWLGLLSDEKKKNAKRQ